MTICGREGRARRALLPTHARERGQGTRARNAVGERGQGTTTTTLPMDAQFQVMSASAVAWRTQPPDSANPS